jgi:glutathione synthase/RimK-type ligase-like ATP-grasp enzyme
MNKIKNHYVIAGLDFIFDKDGKPWFLEANSASTVHKEFEELNGDCTTVKALAKYINRLPGENFCIFVNKNHDYTDKKENSAWMPEKLKPFLKKQMHICYMQNNLRVARNYFVDHNFIKLTLTNFNKGGGNTHVLNSHRRKINPDVILRSYFQLNPEFEQEGINVINTMIARDLVWMKNKCYDIVKDIKGINIPKYFLVDSNEELREVLRTHKKLFKKGYVLKPANDSLGRGIKVSNSLKMPYKFRVKPGYMVQQKIIPELIDKKYYWDTRSFVIDGRFVGGVKRVNRNKVTNIAQGGHGRALEKKYQIKIKRMAEKIVEAIEKEAKRLAKQGYKYILTPENPNLREVRWHPVGEE